MTPVLQLLLALAIIIPAAKLAGAASTRVRQPAVLGEILVGIVLGPTVVNLLGLPFMDDPHLAESLSHMAELGVVFLMFLAGLEADLGQMRRAGRVVVFAGVLGVLVPLAFGWAASLPFGYDALQSLYIGVILTATSVSISAQTMLELGVLRSRVGIALLGAAVVDDVLVILLVSALIAVAAGGGGAGSVLTLLVRMLLYFVLFSLAGRYLVPRLLAWIDRLPVSEGLLAGAIMVTLLYAWAAELLGGVALITGAFLAGIFVARSPLTTRIERSMHGLAYGFFVPIFFVNIGLGANLWALDQNLLVLTLVITIVALVSKVVGSGAGALLGGFNQKDALRLGTGMISRGEVGLIVASLLVNSALLPPELLTVAVIVVLASTLVTPPLLRLAFRESAPANEPAEPLPTES